MPDVKRTVERSVSIIRRRGIDATRAYQTVIRVATLAHYTLHTDSDDDTQWLLDVAQYALERMNATAEAEPAAHQSPSCESATNDTAHPPSTAGQ